MNISNEQLKLLHETWESWRQHPMTSEILKVLQMRREKYINDAVVASVSYHLPAEAVRGAMHCVNTLDAIKILLTDFDKLSNVIQNKKLET